MKKVLKFMLLTFMSVTCLILFSGCVWTSPVTGIKWTPEKAHKVVTVGAKIGKVLYLNPVINDRLSADTKSSVETAYLKAKTTNDFIVEVKKIVKKEVGAVSVEEDTNTLYISTALGELNAVQ